MFQFIATIFILIINILIIIYIYLKFYVYNYWKRHGIPHEKPSVPFGNISSPYSYLQTKTGLCEIILNNYEKFKQYPFSGFYVGYKPIIIINDLQLMRTIFSKEFGSFHSRGWYSNKKLDILSHGMGMMNDKKKWQYIRNKLSPSFTPAKLRQTFSLIMEISNEMIDVCDAELEHNKHIDGKSLSKRFTMDVISSLIFRSNYHCLKNPNNDFYNMTLKAFDWGNIRMAIQVFLPEILESLRISFHPTEVKEFYKFIMRKAIKEQHQESIKRNDIMSLLLEIKDYDTLENNQKDIITDKLNQEESDYERGLDALGTAFLLLIAGYDTSSTAMAYCLYELTIHPEIMEKLQNEIDEVAESPSGFTYDSITTMEYLDMVVTETLRKYPPVQFLNRICHKDFLIPESNYTIPKGMRILISPIGIHQNPEFFPDPMKFDPERYNKQNPDNKRNFVDLSFGEGPRSCIGKKLGHILVKIGIVQLLYNYNISLKKDLNPTPRTNTGNFVQELTDLSLYLEKRKK